MNRAHGRRQIDFTKPLNKIDTAEEFFRQENTEQNDPHHVNIVLQSRIINSYFRLPNVNLNLKMNLRHYSPKKLIL